MATKERYIIDAEGNRVAVVLDTAEYEQLLAELQELREREEMRHYDPARDQDAGLTVKKHLLDELLKEEAEYKSGRVKAKPWDQVKHDLGLDEDV
jgi:PHD/YefM family antitoxin component YafN of YafNO toxin-antitoxin module